MERVARRAQSLRERCLETAHAVRHSSGLRYPIELLRVPGREIHALALVALTQPAHPHPGAHPSVCPAERASCSTPGRVQPIRRRLRDIDAELEEADSGNCRGRAECLRAEREAVESELLRVVGRGGRPRRAPAAAERARLNVTRAIKSAIARVDTAHPELGRHLVQCIRTGTFCVYLPDLREPVSWTLAAGCSRPA
jgi:hypothetical protein